MILFAHLLDSELLPSLAHYEPTTGAMVTGMAIAFGLGAIHAFSPGHGKTLVSAYLIGNQGTPLHALILGVTTSVTHTLGIFALGVVALFASQYLLPEQLYPILSVISGFVVIFVGIFLLKRRLSPHPHPHHPHDHHPITPSSLIALGIASGLVPCPSALVMLLSAIALHHTTYGLLLTGGFSLGLASVLVLLGLLAIYAKKWLEELPHSSDWLQKLPLFSAIFVICVGVGLTVLAIMQI